MVCTMHPTRRENIHHKVYGQSHPSPSQLSGFAGLRWKKLATDWKSVLLIRVASLAGWLGAKTEASSSASSSATRPSLSSMLAQTCASVLPKLDCRFCVASDAIPSQHPSFDTRAPGISPGLLPRLPGCFLQYSRCTTYQHPCHLMDHSDARHIPSLPMGLPDLDAV